MRLPHSATIFFTSIDVPAWMRRALCQRDGEQPEDWFPGSGQAGETTRHALEVCRACPVSRECLTYAMDYRGSPRPLSGIWGGTTDHQRRSAREHARDRKAAR